MFRNRLGRKISFILDDKEFIIPFAYVEIEELGQYLVAADILDNYYQGRGQSAYQQAEQSAYGMGWIGEILR